MGVIVHEAAASSPTAGEGQGARTHRLLLITWLLATLSFVTGVVLMRGHLLDDTFIHLRYADNLSHRGELAYNPGEPSFGTSALTYVFLFAKIAGRVPREALPLIAKWISVGFHAGVLGLLAWRARRLYQQGAPSAALSLSAFALAVALPPSGRWLQDGMETSLAVLLATIAALAGASFRRADSRNPWLGAACGLACALPGCLRVDLLPISVAALGLALLPRRRQGKGVALAWGAALLGTMAFLFTQTGHIVSDSAVAKQAGHIEPMFPLAFLRSMATVSPVWLLGAAWLVWSLRRPSIIATLGLLPIAATLAAGSAVGQFIHGARYFLPTLVFAWIAYIEGRSLSAEAMPSRPERFALIAAMAISILHAFVIAKPLSRVTQPAELHLGMLAEVNETTLLAAHDIGRLGWHTEARVLDLAGLVNGRKLAKAALHHEGLCRAAGELGMPSILVLTDDHARALGHEDAIELRCSHGEARYLRGAEPVMKSWNIATPLEWFVWERVESEPMVTGQGDIP